MAKVVLPSDRGPKDHWCIDSVQFTDDGMAIKMRGPREYHAVGTLKAPEAVVLALYDVIREVYADPSGVNVDDLRGWCALAGAPISFKFHRDWEAIMERRAFSAERRRIALRL